MIGIFLLSPFKGLSSKKMAKLHLHQFGEVLPHTPSDIHPDHLKKFLGLLIEARKMLDIHFLLIYRFLRFSMRHALCPQGAIVLQGGP